MSSETKTQNIPLPPPPVLLSNSANKLRNNRCNENNNENNQNKINSSTSIKQQNLLQYGGECAWAVNHPDAHKAFFFSKVCTGTAPKSCKYFDLQPILQIGPTCGLTAVSMLYNGNPGASFLLEQSRDLQLTNNGEMFSVVNLLNVLHDNLEISDVELDRDRFRAFLYAGNMNCDTIRNYLVDDNAVILFPYDVDLNHSPCLKDGTKAHWGLIVGSAIDAFDEFYVIARHGKSRNLAVWTLDSVAKSNSNLNRVESKNDEKFVLPPGGISGELGLKSKCIVIIGLANRLINIV